MRSQVRSLRHTIMALVTIASLMGLAPYSALAASMTVTDIFTLDTTTPAHTLAGTVTVNFSFDSASGGDGFITESELTFIKATWAPAPFFTPPTFMITHLSQSAIATNDTTFIYNLSTSKIIDLVIQDNPSGSNALIQCAAVASCAPGDLMDVQAPGGEGSATYRIRSQEVLVPEPSTAILLSLGLVGMILYAFSRCLRPVAPRRVPVVDATR